MPRLSRVKLIVNRKLFIVLLFLLFTIHYSLFTTPSPSFAAPPDPKPCFNPIPTDNLTDNYITDDTDEGDPPGPQGKDNIEALKFTFVTSGAVGTVPDLKKTMTFTADFSKLQAIFGAPTSNYVEGRAQSPEYTQANLLDLKNPRLIQKHQGPIGKTNPTAVTDDLRIKYVNYVNDTPTLAESKQEFSDYNGQNKKTIDELYNGNPPGSGFGDPKPPSPSDDRTSWINTWGKYWENIPTTYNEFYIGKLEFRPVHGTTAIKDLKDGKPGACFPNTTLRTVEFPVPNFFRSAATSGVLNLAMLPKSAWSDQNDLMGIQGAVAGVKTSASDFIKNCFKFATNNPITNMVKKAIKVSMQKLIESQTVYASSVSATVLSGERARINISPTVNNEDLSPVIIVERVGGGEVANSRGLSNGTNSWITPSLTPDNYRAALFLIGGLGGIPDSNWAYFNIAASAVGATGLNTSNEACDAALQVNITFNWTPQPEGAFFQTQAQWLDLSTFAPDPFSDYLPHRVDGLSSYSTTTAPGNIGPLDPGKTHFWRINTLNRLNGLWATSATGTFTTKDCHYTINPPVISRVGNEKVVTFTFSPASRGNIALLVYPDVAGARAVFDSGIIPTGISTIVWDSSVTLPNTPPRWGHKYKAVIIEDFLNKASTEPDVVFDIVYDLDIPKQVGRDIIFTWAPPIHLDPASGNAMAIIVDTTDQTPNHLAKDSLGLPINSSTFKWERPPAGAYKACIKFNGLTILDDEAHNCKFFTVTFIYPWTVFDLSDKSCIKVGKEGKAGNAPFCAIYPTKFEPGHISEQNIIPGVDSCTAGTNTFFKSNTDSDNVVCTFKFEWKSTDYTGKTDKNGKSISLEIPTAAEGNGNWDECDPEIGGFRTCYLTVGVWPDFRVPYLGQIWNNSLFSDTLEYLPTRQTTGQPGVYTLWQPKPVAEELAKDPMQVMIDKCASSPSDGVHIPAGCNDLLNYGNAHAAEIPGYSACVGAALLNIPALIACFDSVTRTLIDKKLPGEVSGGGVAGISTGGGSVLGSNSGNQKERLIGAVDCAKHFSRDIALKPKVLQQSLGIQQDCNLTASALPPGGISPDPPSPTPTSPPFSPPPIPGGCGPVADTNPANGIETGPDELMCYITSVASGRVEKKTNLPLDQVMLGVMDRESSGGQCATAASGEIGVFQYIAATWKTVGWDGGAGEDSGKTNPGIGNACWGSPGQDPVATASDAGCPNCFNWPFHFGATNDGDAWNPYHQITATADEMERSGGCPWSTFWGLYEFSPLYGEKLCPAVSGSPHP